MNENYEIFKKKIKNNSLINKIDHGEYINFRENSRLSISKFEKEDIQKILERGLIKYGTLLVGEKILVFKKMTSNRTKNYLYANPNLHLRKFDDDYWTAKIELASTYDDYYILDGFDGLESFISEFSRSLRMDFI